MRRAVAAVALLVILILVILGVHSCQVSQTNSALRDYSNSVASVMRSSINNGQQFFTLLASGGGSSNAPALHSQIDETRLTAQGQLNNAQGFSVPDQDKTAQQEVLLSLQMRLDGISNIAQQIEPALQASTSTAAVNQIAAEMARFYSSDVTYKDYALPGIVSALHSAGISVGGSNGQPLETGQFLPSLQWLTPTYIAQQLHTTVKTANANCTPSAQRGHSVNSVSVGGNTLQSGSTNTVPASPPPTFSLTIGTGNMTETNVTLKVTLSGSSISGQTVLPQTPANQTATGQVTLNGSPPPGNYTVTAQVVPVPCEENTSNNTVTFPVTFQ
ncbi:MAG TPA: hypothetical protein VMP89_09470 [Solirubrobacteraceae bacterium]|nr:hypothetical protein [Solirubrobacteraceae bacterium]